MEELTDWRQSDREIEEDYLIAYYDGKDIEDKENIIFKNMYEDTEETVYVTSIIFEPEPEFDENKSTDKHVYNKEDVEYVQLIIE